MKKKFLMFAAAIASFIFARAQTGAAQQYINTYKDIAVNEMIRTGVPASITLAQGILESQSGQSDLVKQSNNHFGIKCKLDWTGAVVYHDDDTQNECFRSYQSAEDSYRDHSDFLKTRPNYASLFKLDPSDYTSWARGLKKAGYATEYNYAPMLIKVIEDNNLEQYTDIALQRMHGSQPAETAAGSDVPVNSTYLNTGNTQANNQVSDINENADVSPGPHTAVQSYPEGIFSINQAKVVYAHTGTSLFALASNNNISYASLLEFNDFNNRGAILNSSQLVFLERKPKRGDKDFHIVAAHETLEDIAQEEGVRLESILQYNQLQKGMQPETGEKIYLRAPFPVSPKTAKK